MQKYIKSFYEKNRFNNEIYFYNIFKNLGFNVCKCICCNIEKQTVTYELIKETRKISTKDFKYLIMILSNIFQNSDKIIQIPKSEELKIKENYINGSIKNLKTYYNLSKSNELYLTNDFYNNFILSVFKDSKYSNWMVKNDKIFMIDFDYVVNSFFLSDLAQFVTTTGLIIEEIFLKNLYKEILENFLSNIFPRENLKILFKKYELFFLISCLYSNSKKVMFPHNYDFNLLEKENSLIMNNIIRENEKLYI